LDSWSLSFSRQPSRTAGAASIAPERWASTIARLGGGGKKPECGGHPPSADLRRRSFRNDPVSLVAAIEPLDLIAVVGAAPQFEVLDGGLSAGSTWHEVVEF